MRNSSKPELILIAALSPKQSGPILRLVQVALGTLNFGPKTGKSASA